jgi:hypothetical protein
MVKVAKYSLSASHEYQWKTEILKNEDPLGSDTDELYRK